MNLPSNVRFLLILKNNRPSLVDPPLANDIFITMRDVYVASCRYNDSIPP